MELPFAESLSLLDRMVEALLFEASEAASTRSLAQRAARALQQPVTPDAVRDSVERLRERLAAQGSALDVFEWSGGYRLATRAELGPLLAAAREHDVPASRRLSPTLLETLAVVAYRQPVTKPEVDFVRGVDSDYALRRLAELGFVEEAGRADSIGRPLLYATTPAFLDLFGLSSLEALPPLREIESVLNDPAFNRERARLLALHAPPDPSASPTDLPPPDAQQ